MSEKILNYQSTIQFAGLKAGQPSSAVEIETGTCTEAEPFALQVKGDSMAPEFHDGCVVIVDPSVDPTHGSFVIADCGEDGYLLRRLNIGDDVWRLTTLKQATLQRPTAEGITAGQRNAAAEIKIAPDKSAILGVVIQRTGARRSANKTYS